MEHAAGQNAQAAAHHPPGQAVVDDAGQGAGTQARHEEDGRQGDVPRHAQHHHEEREHEADHEPEAHHPDSEVMEHLPRNSHGNPPLNSPKN